MRLPLAFPLPASLSAGRAADRPPPGAPDAPGATHDAASDIADEDEVMSAGAAAPIAVLTGLAVGAGIVIPPISSSGLPATGA